MGALQAYKLHCPSELETWETCQLFCGSVSAPFGFAIGSFFTNVIGELFLYDFSTSTYDFKGVGVQAGISPGFFIGDVSLSATMSGGIFHAGTGFIAGGSIDIPVGESFEVRLTARNNIVQKDGGGFTGWIGAGLSLGYEF